MPERHDKRDSMSMGASVSDMDFEWIDGIDGASMIGKARPSKV